VDAIINNSYSWETSLILGDISAIGRVRTNARAKKKKTSMLELYVKYGRTCLQLGSIHTLVYTKINKDARILRSRSATNACSREPKYLLVDQRVVSVEVWCTCEEFAASTQR
jgi:hypothetical protein